MNVPQVPAEALAEAHTSGWTRLPGPERARMLADAEQWLSAARAADIVWPAPVPPTQQVREIRDFVQARLAEARTEEEAGIAQDTWWWVSGSYALDALEDLASTLFSALEVWAEHRPWNSALPGMWAKRERTFYASVEALGQVEVHVLSERAWAVMRAQARGLYDAVPFRAITKVTQGRQTRVHWVDRRDGHGAGLLSDLGWRERQLLFWEEPAGPEPAWLWLTERGLPMVPDRWDQASRGNVVPFPRS